MSACASSRSCRPPSRCGISATLAQWYLHASQHQCTEHEPWPQWGHEPWWCGHGPPPDGCPTRKPEKAGRGPAPAAGERSPGGWQSVPVSKFLNAVLAKVSAEVVPVRKVLLQ
eukprot:scaffold172163_cov17-Tisochrysis_lutea.AAC.1